MVMTVRLISTVLLLLASSHASVADASCSDVNAESVKSVRACLESIPGLGPQLASDNITKSMIGCTLLRTRYTGANPANRDADRQPTCVMFGRVVADIQGEEPAWQNCAQHFEHGKKLRQCLDYIVDSLPVRNRVAMDCKQAQLILRSMSFGLRKYNTEAYSPPDCGPIDASLDKNPLLAEARQPQAAGDTRRQVDSRSTSRSSAATGDVARTRGESRIAAAAAGEAKPEGIHNQLRVIPGKDKRNRTYFVTRVFSYQDRRQTVTADQIGECAPRLFVSVKASVAGPDFDLSQYPDVSREIRDIVTEICPQVNNILYRSIQTGNGEQMTRYYRSRSKQKWKLARFDDPFAGRDRNLRITFVEGRANKKEIIGYLRNSDELSQYLGQVKKNGDISGYWYSFGGPKGGRCGKLRRGYPMWGKFEIPGGKNLMGLGYCEEAARPPATFLPQLRDEVDRITGQ